MGVFRKYLFFLTKKEKFGETFRDFQAIFELLGLLEQVFRFPIKFPGACFFDRFWGRRFRGLFALSERFRPFFHCKSFFPFLPKKEETCYFRIRLDMIPVLC